MKNNLPAISPSYKKKLSGAIISVILFFIFYLFLILIALGIAGLLGFSAYKIASLKFSYFTAVIGLAIVGAGISIFYYLIKFIFINIQDGNNERVEITKESQPELFNLIDEIVKETGTQSPKKVFITAEVNASVSYNSIFWSMFLPVKKNLTIGLGLINSTTIGELKSILTHEFGHFSQRSMKVGGYVNQANRIIYDTVYNNKNYEDGLLQSNSHWAWQLMGAIAVLVIRVMQYFLKISSEFLFKNHASLSREMEFHADAISTYITNPTEQISSLLRIDLSHAALQNSIQFYADSEGIYKTKNLYENQTYLIKKIAAENNHVLINGLPKLDVEDISRYDKSKLEIEDAFASHPDTKDRIKHILKNETKNIAENNNLSQELIRGYEALCEAITKKVFKYSTIKDIGDFISDAEFKDLYAEKYPEMKFSDMYNGYYNQHQPVLKDAESIALNHTTENLSTLFNDEKVSDIYEKNGAQNDLNVLKILADTPVGIKTFRYDGILYKVKEAKNLLPKVTAILDSFTKKVQENDESIFKFFYQNADELQKSSLISAYKKLSTADGEFDRYIEVINSFSEYLQFISITLPIEEIRKHRAKLLEQEKTFKVALTEFTSVSAFRANIPEDKKESFKNYLNAEYVYFEHESYKDEELKVLFESYQDFNSELSNAYILLKQNVMKIQEDINCKVDVVIAE